MPAVTANVFNRRRAERFAQLLDETNGIENADGELARSVAVRDRLTALQPSVEIDPEFRTGLRAMLVATAERDGIGSTAVEPEEHESRQQRRAVWRRRAPRLVIVGVAVGIVTVSGASAASERAMPGDALYGVKRSAERTQLALARSDVTRGQLLLSFARTRVAEAEAVRGEASSFAGALGDMDSDTREGVKLLTTSAVQRGDEVALDAIDTFVSQQRGDLSGMLSSASGAERERVLSSLGLLGDVSQRSKGLRTTLSCGATASGDADVLGPKPASCVSASGSGNGETGQGSKTGERDNGQTSPGRTENDPSKAPGAGPSEPGATPSGSAPAQPDPSPSASDEGGIIDGLGRILDDLLG
ncbi:hypothetical protein Pa4123_07590 [Phytohabitans aurantiacus]|uniref:DUF5667 domain-containing protein n=1 Tax=Phytohabitans aurantiacus TaxID=3016789 RepID=A0ABQ5QNS1_9ACTN|nr:hypothetical protein Pa4123_07590 [Phytohabitans aurantiacus]